jgi:YidC/Oxa1 family membrane protein insertase
MSISAAFGAVTGAAHSAIEAIATLLTPLTGGLAAALAVVVFTLLVRLAISPLAYLQARSARRGAALAPEIAVLRQQHRADPKRLAAETLALQRAHGVSPFAGLLPALAQAPFFMIMYRVALNAPAGAVFGIPLGAHLIAGWPVFAVLLIMSLLLARRFASMAARNAPAAAPGDPVAQAAGLLRYLPYLTVLTVAWLPLAGGLYLVTSTAWTALEQLVLRRPV